MSVPEHPAPPSSPEPWSLAAGRAPALEAAFMSGSDGALKQVYAAHGSLVYGICRRALSPEQADEVAQDVFLNAWRARSQFDPSRGTLPAWLVGITRRRVIDHLRSERRHSDRRAAEGDLPEPASEAAVERIAERMLVADAVRDLPDRAREAIQLAYVHDLTHQQISERTGRALGTVKSDIRRGLQKIRHQLETTSG